MKLTHFLLLLMILSTTTRIVAQAGRRALVIGNDTYPGNVLQNARNDARAVGDLLKKMGYPTTVALDLDRARLYRTIDTFAASLAEGDAAVLYYAGHGIQVDGENYLVPTDFHVADDTDVKVQGLGLSTVLSKLKAHGAITQIIILDACRNNPFLFVRGAEGGWAGTGTSAGTLLAFGTSPGATARDDPREAHGLFTMSLLKYMALPSVEIEQMLQEVRRDVIDRSHGQQIPWTASSLIGSFHMQPTEDLGAPVLVSTYLRSETPDPGWGGTASLRNRSMGGLPGGEDQDGRTDAQLSEAMVQLRGFHFDAAVAILRAIISVDPRCALALRLLGVALHLGGQRSEGDRVLDSALLLNPNDREALAFRCLIKAGYDTAGSMDDCRRSITFDDDSVEAHLGLAINMYSGGQYKDAEIEADRAIVLDPEAPANFTLRGDLAIVQNKNDLALHDFAMASRLALANPN